MAVQAGLGKHEDDSGIRLDMALKVSFIKLP
jgi:hypothetical protein